MSLKSPTSLYAASTHITSFPREIHLNVLTFLRATDLSALQRTCRCFNNRDLIVEVVEHAANHVVSMHTTNMIIICCLVLLHNAIVPKYCILLLALSFSDIITIQYPSELTKGFDTPIVSGEVKSMSFIAKKGAKIVRKETKKGNAAALTLAVVSTEKTYTYEMLRNMEMLVVARVLSRPEPPLQERSSAFYVSKSWCRAALRWLEVQEEERKEREERHRVAEEAKAALATPTKGRKKAPHPGSSSKKKLSRKEQRQRDRRMSDASPPWSNINTDLVCEHGDLMRCSSKSARARRRVMDKQAWKVLKRLYPDSIQLDASVGSTGCLVCAAETETAKKAELDQKEEEKAERRKPLACPLVRGFYTRGSKGYPTDCLVTPNNETKMGVDGFHCPLKPGVYSALPRSWCHRFRKYIKTGEGGFPPAPDASDVLCDAHNFPLVPPHLESFLRGETSTLLGGNTSTTPRNDVSNESRASLPRPNDRTLSASRADADTLLSLRAAGFSELDLHAQRVAMAGLEASMQRANIHGINDIQIDDSTRQFDRSITNAQLDRENRVVVEILTDEEITALEKWWPRLHGFYALKFAIVEDSSTISGTDILWSTPPCRECDASSRATENFAVRNRLQKRLGR
eukprot:scaffold7621_cov152-Skeletonema_menzelii.AAC.9